MLEAVKEIGKIILKESGRSRLQTLIEDPNANGKYLHVCAIILTLGNPMHFVDVQVEDYSRDKKELYLYRKWNANGPNFSPTALFVEAEKTFKNKILGYFNKIGHELKDLNLTDDEKSFIDSAFSCLKDSQDTIIELLSEEREKYPNLIITLKFKEGEFARYIGEYDIFKNILSKLSDKDTHSLFHENGVCSVCGEKKEVVLGDINVYKFYTTDKPGFIAGGFRREDSWKNFPVCPECKTYLEEGKRYISQNLTFNFSGIKYQLIPKFILGKEMVPEEALKMFTNQEKLISLKKEPKQLIANDELEILYYLKDLKDSLTLNFLFLEVRGATSAEKILALIEDVLPSRLMDIFNAKDSVDKIFNSNFTFGTIRSFFRKSDEAKRNKTKRNNDLDGYFLDIVNRVFKCRRIDEDFLYQFLIRRVREAFVNINNESSTSMFYFSMKDAMMVVKFLEKLSLIKMEEVTMEERIFDDFFKKFENTFESPLKRGLFLLGVLTQLLLNKQSADRGSAPFMKNLKGLKMRESDFKGLLPKVQNKLMEYDKFRSGEKKLANEVSYYLLLAGDNWKMGTDKMNFYFVSGMNLAQEIANIIYNKTATAEAVSKD